MTIYPTSIVDGKLENCASKVAQIRLSRRAELVLSIAGASAGSAPQQGMPDWLLLAVRPGGIRSQLR